MPCFNDQHLIDEQRARRNEQRVLMRAGNDVHLARHAGHKIFRRIFEIEHDWCNAASPDRPPAEWKLTLPSNCPRPIRIDLHDRFHPDLHFADVFLVHFAADIIFPRRNGEELIALRHELAVDRLDVGKNPVHRSDGFRSSSFALRVFAPRSSALRGCDRARFVPSSAASRKRFTSLLAFSYSTAGTLLSAASFSSRSTFASAILSGSAEGNVQFARSLRRLQIGPRLFQLTRGCFVGDRGEQFAFLQRLADRAAPGRQEDRPVE